MDFLLPVRRAKYAGKEGWLKLREDTDADFRATRFMSLSTQKQLTMDPKTGRTVADGLIMNTDAFSQISGLIAGGLSRTLSTVSQESKCEPDLIQEAVIRSFNALLRISFHQFEGSKLVIDRRRSEILGIVGKNYQFVANNRLVVDFSPNVLTTAYPRYSLLSAVVRNRDIRVVLERASESVEERGVRYTQGLVLYNSETTRRAVFLPQIVIDSETHSFAMASREKTNYIIHRKSSNFATTLATTVKAALNAPLQLSTWVASIRMLRQTPIGTHSCAELRPKLTAALETKGVTMAAIRTVMDDLTAQCGKRPPMMWHRYRALLVAAKKHPATERLLRQMAFRQLRKKVK